MTDDQYDLPGNTMLAFAEMSRLDQARHTLSTMWLDLAIFVHNLLVPDGLREAASKDARDVDHHLHFERQTRPDGANVYVFWTESGKRIELDPGTTVSELQNRL
jgi:hypothetical protein